jgi:hypothetical protein
LAQSVFVLFAHWPLLFAIVDPGVWSGAEYTLR